MRLFPVSAFPLRTFSITMEQITLPVPFLLSFTSVSGAMLDFRVFDFLPYGFTVVLSEITSCPPNIKKKVVFVARQILFFAQQPLKRFPLISKGLPPIRPSPFVTRLLLPQNYYVVLKNCMYVYEKDVPVGNTKQSFGIGPTQQF